MASAGTGRVIAVATAALLLAAPLASAAEPPRPVDHGSVRVLRSVAAVALGADREAVAGRLGPPVDPGGGDQWSYDGPRTTFWVAFDRDRVVRIAASGRGAFCLRRGVCTGSRGGVGYLRRRYGSRLRFFRAEDGTRAAIVTGRVRGRRVFTIFGRISSRRATGRFQSVLVGDCSRGQGRPC